MRMFFSSGAVEMQKVMKTTSKSDSKYFQKCLFITALLIQRIFVSQIIFILQREFTLSPLFFLSLIN
jgi:hypothetical protein